MPDLQVKINPLLDYHSFDVSRYSDYFMLKFPDGNIFAQVSEFASRGFATIENLSSIEIRAFVETKRIQHVFIRAKKPGEATLKVDINVYGSVSDAEVVGSKLSSAKLYLQDPDNGMHGISYVNPQIVQFPEIEEPVINNETHMLEAIPAVNCFIEEKDNFAQIRSTIYQSLTRFRNLERMEGGARILTPLLPYVYLRPTNTRLAFQQNL